MYISLSVLKYQIWIIDHILLKLDDSYNWPNLRVLKLVNCFDLQPLNQKLPLVTQSNIYIKEKTKNNNHICL